MYINAHKKYLGNTEIKFITMVASGQGEDGDFTLSVILQLFME